MTLLILGIIGVIILYLIATYNKFVSIKTQITASIQEIGNQLKRQADLIPNLTASVKGYIKHEKDIFKAITDARKQAIEAVGGNGNDAQSLIDASTKLEKALAPIRVTLESTPELKADAPTQKLMDELRDTADKTMYARRTLIDLTQNYNELIVKIPSNFIAMIFGFKQEPGLKMAETEAATSVSAEETKSPKVEL
ncbi:LemA family protein [Candidatus Beckwithbacteria bacterium]|nr:LemA family protein [Candidatus Beckwithbacteria bacterium]